MENNTELTPERKRPVNLTVLCVIAFLHVGMSIITGVIGTLLSPELGWFETKGFFGFYTDGMNSILGFTWSLVMLALSIIAFIGILQIWRLNKLGVWLFSIPLFFTIIIPLIKMGIGWWILIPNITIIFFLIFLFALNYQKLPD